MTSVFHCVFTRVVELVNIFSSVFFVCLLEFSEVAAVVELSRPRYDHLET